MTGSNFWLEQEHGNELVLYCHEDDDDDDSSSDKNKKKQTIRVLSALSTFGRFQPSGWKY
jgi:hypothetical protein